jgi:hypothetical protein
VNLHLVARCPNGHPLIDMELDPQQVVYRPVLEEHEEDGAVVGTCGPPNPLAPHKLACTMHHFQAAARVMERIGCPKCQRARQLVLAFPKADG